MCYAPRPPRGTMLYALEVPELYGLTLGDTEFASAAAAWDALPESFPISRATAHRRFTEWVDQGVMQALHQAALDVLGVAGQIDWSRASVDAMHVRAVKGGT